MKTGTTDAGRKNYPIEEQLADCYSFLGIPWENNMYLTEERMLAIENSLNGLFVWVEHPGFVQYIPQFKVTGQFPFQDQKANIGLDEYTKLILAEQTCHTIEIREKATGKEGVANTCADGVELFYGDEEGDDDKAVGIEEFNRDFEITAMIDG